MMFTILKNAVKEDMGTRRLKMIGTIFKIDGMMCGMCETHIGDTVRRWKRLWKRQ